jgi:hypothetical protein
MTGRVGSTVRQANLVVVRRVRKRKRLSSLSSYDGAVYVCCKEEEIFEAHQLETANGGFGVLNDMFCSKMPVTNGVCYEE